MEIVQRHDLNPLEEAQGYKRLIDDFSLIKIKFQDLLVKQDYITNSLRLLNLPTEVLKLIEEKMKTSGHAKILLVWTMQSLLQIRFREKIICETS